MNRAQPTANRIEGKFYAGGYSQFFEDPEQIILDGVFTESEPLRNLAIAAIPRRPAAQSPLRAC